MGVFLLAEMYLCILKKIDFVSFWMRGFGVLIRMYVFDNLRFYLIMN